MTRQGILLVLVFLLGAGSVISAQEPRSSGEKPIPVIFDTDIGEDIDDAWALVFAVKSPRLDVKLITTGFGSARQKIKIVAKLLRKMDRTDIPIGYGYSTGNWPPKFMSWAEDVDLSQYEGEVIQEGIQKIIDVIQKDETGRLKLFSMGPMQNIAAALRKNPFIVNQVHEFVAMAGSVRHGYDPDEKPTPESNVASAIPSAKQVLAADWNRMTIAPTDTAAEVQLTGDRYRRIVESDLPVANALVNAFRIHSGGKYDATKRSSTLYDTVAVHLGASQQFLKVEKLPLIVTNQGLTKIDRDAGNRMHVATEWTDRAAFKDHLVEQILEKK